MYARYFPFVSLDRSPPFILLYLPGFWLLLTAQKDSLAHWFSVEWSKQGSLSREHKKQEAERDQSWSVYSLCSLLSEHQKQVGCFLLPKAPTPFDGPNHTATSLYRITTSYPSIVKLRDCNGILLLPVLENLLAFTAFHNPTNKSFRVIYIYILHDPLWVCHPHST